PYERTLRGSIETVLRSGDWVHVRGAFATRYCFYCDERADSREAWRRARTSMPRLDTTLHIDMYRAAKKRRTLPSRIKQALKILLGRDDLYGMEWGDPDSRGPLTYIRDCFLLPYITNEAT